MSVLIKGMEMPKNCKKCGFRHLRWKFLQCPYEGEIDVSQSEDCPLVEVKTPHGRLIDADNQMKVCMELVTEILYPMDSIDEAEIVSMVKNAPTVIESEE